MPKKLYNLNIMFWLQDLISILSPELLVLLALIIAVFLSTSGYKDIIWIVSVLLMSTGCLHLVKSSILLTEPIQILNGMFIADNLSTLMRLLILFTAILIILGSVKYSEGFIHKSEFFIVLLAAVLGSMFLVSANDLITLFIALETLGLSSIMLIGYSKYDSRSNEAALKYLLNSASASAIFLFGLSLIYGITGATQFQEIKYKLLQLSANESISSSLLIIVLILILGGLAFKLGSAPLHMWSPDVYEGAPTPATAFLSVISKAAGFAISLRILITLFDFANQVWQPILLGLAVLSMLLGNFVALGEAINKSSIKRLMAYSSIAQVGYILIGLALFTDATVSASIFYIIVYSIMNLGAFLCIIAFGNEANSDSISDYSGLVKKKPLLAFAFSICLFNLAGLPLPPAGFIAKFILFKASFESGHIGIILGTLALLTTILSIYYYLLIVKLMLVDKPSEAVLKIGSENKELLGKSNALNAAIAISVSVIFIAAIVSSGILKATNNTTASINPNQERLISHK